MWLHVDAVHVVQFYPWFKFYYLLFHIHYHILTLKREQRKIKTEPSIKLNYNIDILASKKNEFTVECFGTKIIHQEPLEAEG